MEGKDKMNVRQTSLFAYKEAQKNLGSKQQAVLDVIKNYPGCDNLFISQKLRWPINSITPRVNELRQLGMVKEWGKAKNVMTGRVTLRWEENNG